MMMPPPNAMAPPTENMSDPAENIGSDAPMLDPTMGMDCFMGSGPFSMGDAIAATEGVENEE